ncbi:hypothetical protein [Celerinatantimonas yamalensis]|uniref:Uncharacterized protein n=1 Tax=Celerinatantimonas yamalensis TaxID=559956 RepID=A0ABW9GA52_9GAMM
MTRRISIAHPSLSKISRESCNWANPPSMDGGIVEHCFAGEEAYG